jgi:hypothetical protein
LKNKDSQLILILFASIFNSPIVLLGLSNFVRSDCYMHNPPGKLLCDFVKAQTINLTNKTIIEITQIDCLIVRITQMADTP